MTNLHRSEAILPIAVQFYFLDISYEMLEFGRALLVRALLFLLSCLFSFRRVNFPGLYPVSIIWGSASSSK
jgi:hypothetical protein